MMVRLIHYIFRNQRDTCYIVFVLHIKNQDQEFIRQRTNENLVMYDYSKEEIFEIATKRKNDWLLLKTIIYKA